MSIAAALAACYLAAVLAVSVGRLFFRIANA
jgi:hypothetical protein